MTSVRMVEPAPEHGSATMEHPARTRVPALDGLRGIAILLVMICHFTQQLSPPTGIARILVEILHAGRHGVDLFFVLSGYLITGILVDSRGAPLAIRNFFARRALRIFPLYFSVLIACLVILPLAIPPERLGTRIVLDHQRGLWLYYSNLQMAWSGEWLYEGRWLHFAHFWSLAIEEQFYLAWPFVVALLRPRALIGACIAVIATATTARAVLAWNGVEGASIFLLTPCRLDTLAVGALIAACERDPNARPILARAAMPVLAISAAAAACLFALASGAAILTQTFKYSALAGCFGALLVLAAKPGATLARTLERPTLRFFGRYSYGMYVFHALLLPVYLAGFGPSRLAPIVGPSPIADAVFVVLAIAASTGCALLSWWCLEARMLGLKRMARMPVAMPPAP